MIHFSLGIKMSSNQQEHLINLFLIFPLFLLCFHHICDIIVSHVCFICIKCTVIKHVYKRVILTVIRGKVVKDTEKDL